MITRYDEGELHWIDLDCPSHDEVVGLAETYNLAENVVEELASPGSQPRVDILPSYIYLRLHFPIFDKRENGKEDRSQELNIILGKDYLITTHYERVRPLFTMGKIIETSSVLGKSPYDSSPQKLFFALMDKLYRAIGIQLKDVDDRLAAIEDHVFTGREREMVLELSKASHDLIDLRRDLRAHGPVLSSFSNAFRKLFNHGFEFELESLRSRQEELQMHLDDNRELLNELQETNNSLLSTKTNEAIKVLSIMGFIMFPLTLIAGIFGMDTVSTPLLGQEQDFWLVMAFMAFVFVILWSYLSKKGWLR